MNRIIQTNVIHIGDPMIVLEDDKYYMFATTSTHSFDCFISEDLRTFTKLPRPALANEDSFANFNMWAPEVYKIDGRFYMAYSGKVENDSLMHINIAVSDNVTGPYADMHKEPVLMLDKSTIDAHIFIDDGVKFLFYSLDCSTNLINGIKTSQIYVVQLNDDFKPVGEHRLVATPNRPWESLSLDTRHLWNEGPVVLKHNGKYYLTVSANCYATKYYCLGCYVSNNITGPYEKMQDSPIMEYIEGEISGPGHNNYFVDKDGNLKCVFHIHTDINHPSGDRKACICDAHFANDRLVIDYK